MANPICMSKKITKPQPQGPDRDVSIDSWLDAFAMISPRAYTAQEVQDVFLTHVATVTKYWSELPGLSVQKRCEGVALGILAALDGAAADLPPFKLIPMPSDSDREDSRELGRNWFPRSKDRNDCDIAGVLHDRCHLFFESSGETSS